MKRERYTEPRTVFALQEAEAGDAGEMWRYGEYSQGHRDAGLSGEGLMRLLRRREVSSRGNMAQAILRDRRRRG